MSHEANSRYIDVDERGGAFKVSRRNFTSPEIMKREMETIFNKCWIYVGHDSEVSAPNSFLTRQVGGREVIFNRDSSGQVHVFLNVCPHRGASVCRERSGTARAFQCFYHGWVFGSEGSLRHLPFKDNYPAGFQSRPEVQLATPAKLDQYAGFWFICFDPNAVSLKTYLAGTLEYFDRIANYSAAGVVAVPGAYEYTVRANWKLLIENVVDRYHAEATHASYIEHLNRQAVEATKHGLAPDEGRVNLVVEAVARDLGNGHSVSETMAPFGRPIAKWHPSWGEDGKREIGAVYQELVERLGEEKAYRLANYNFNVVVFPNLAIVDVHTTNIRTIFPVSPDEMSVRNSTLAPAHETAAMRNIRLQNTMEFLGPAGFGTPDDNAALESCQRDYHIEGAQKWNDISGGMLGGNPGESEITLRTFWKQWDHYIRETA